MAVKGLTVLYFSVEGSDALCVSNDGLLNTKPVHKEVVKVSCLQD